MVFISSTAFGDYMTPPPCRQAVPHHDAIIADMDKSHTEYKENEIQKKLVSWIPVYNIEKYLERCVGVDFKAELIPNFELLINDGSTDQSGDFIDQLVSKNEENIRFFILRTLEFPMPEIWYPKLNWKMDYLLIVMILLRQVLETLISTGLNKLKWFN